ncbi:MAG: sulfatase-like hydrolase/transferase [Candidatus Aminicenantes bacterium]
MKILAPLILLVLAGGISTNFTLLGSVSEQEDLNVLLITIDTIRPDRLSCYSTKYLKTPRIEALAESGVVFDRAFALNPSTLPSHANVLLGTTPLFHGVHDNGKFKVSEGFLTLAEYLKESGYSTGAFIGAFPLDSRFGLSQGFDVYDESYSLPGKFTLPERRAEDVIQAAFAWLERQNSKWFSWIHLWDPHTMYFPPEPFRTKFKDDLYSGEVAYVDSELGKLFDFLEEEGFLENTLVVLTGDHGESLGEHGELTHNYFAYNSTLWAPLIIAGPGIESRRIAEYVCHVDIFPTVCDILEMEKPPFLQGVSLLPLMEGKKIGERIIYFESLDPYYNMGLAPLRGFIEKEGKFFDSPLPEFYDLENDFNEDKNIIERIDRGTYKKKLEELIKDLSSEQAIDSARRMDQDTQKKLRSLGYIASPTAQLKQEYGTEDDLKIFLPFQQKLDRAIILYDQGKEEESIRELEEIIEKKKDMTPAYLYLHSMYWEKGQVDKALAVMVEGFRNNPENYEIVKAYGTILVEKVDLDKGIEILHNALGILDFDPEVFNKLGLAYIRKGEEQKALEHLNRALELDNNHAGVYVNLGSLYFEIFTRTKREEDHAQSMYNFKKAIECDPKMALAYRGLGAGYKVAGQVDAAISVWEQGLKLNPKDDFIVVNLGYAYFEKGDKTQALKYFERYLSLRGQTLSPEESKRVAEFIRRCKE